jgi:nitroimidazol reductase NimA-like FMN-containing flavoprotein (pyridoxamine 5'-phosphate oxidase superfamily)
MLGALTSNPIETVLNGEVVGSIGCHEEGTTFVVPTTYSYGYGRTKEVMKLNLTRKNQEVCFEVGTMENMNNRHSVIVWRTYKELVEPEALKAGIKN